MGANKSSEIDGAKSFVEEQLEEGVVVRSGSKTCWQETVGRRIGRIISSNAGGDGWTPGTRYYCMIAGKLNQICGTNALRLVLSEFACDEVVVILKAAVIGTSYLRATEQQ